MSEISINPKCSSKWSGDIWEITDNDSGLKATVTETGGRLIGLELDGQELVYSKAELFSKIPDVMQKDRKDVGWDEILLGGEKTWIAPQALFGGKVPFLVPDIGNYTIEPIADGLKLTSAVCPETGLQVVRCIRFGTNGPGTFQITAQLVNHSSEERLVAPWSVFQLPSPATVKVGPLSTYPKPMDEKKGFPKDAEIQSTDGYNFEFFIGAQDQSYKTGFRYKGDEGQITVTYPSGITLIESFLNPQGVYPHYGRAELYIGKGYFETEVLGSLESLNPGAITQPLVIDFRVSRE